MDDSFSSSLSHLLAELKRIELKLHLQVIKSRQANICGEKDKFRGLYISDQEIDSIIGISVSPQGDIPPQPIDSVPVTLGKSLANLEADIARRKQGSLQNGLVLRLHQLEHLFSLSTFDIDILLVCILPELDLRYQRLYAYLQDDLTKKSPTVDLILSLLCNSFNDRLKARQAFSLESPLIKNHLVHLYEEHPQKATPLLAKGLQADEGITSYLLGADQIDTHLLTFTHLLHPKAKLISHDIRCHGFSGTRWTGEECI
ncbi:hypothetical protein ACFLTP_10240 [Chloroflexota bacterium]